MSPLNRAAATATRMLGPARMSLGIGASLLIPATLRQGFVSDKTPSTLPAPRHPGEYRLWVVKIRGGAAYRFAPA
jgi:hypothetical protein